MIDSGIEDPWPPEVLEAVARFKQGDLIAAPPFFYVSKRQHGIWDVTRASEDSDEADVLLELEPEDRPAYGLITTQTCDLTEEDSKNRKPWIQVAPCYDAEELFDKGYKGNVRKDRVPHLMRLTGKDLPTGFWVVDLRIEFPIEKSWLVDVDPVLAFADEAGYLNLGARLAGRLERPALSRSLNEVVRSLNTWLDNLDPDKVDEVYGPVVELRLAYEGDRIHPTSARLLILTEENPLTEEAVEEWNQWWDGARAGFSDLTLVGNRFETLHILPAIEYRNSIALDFRYLSPEDS